MRQEIVGQPLDRVDGRLKVSGGARYPAEFSLKNMAYAVIVRSTITRGSIQSIETIAAERAPGVLKVLTYLNAPKLPYQAPREGSVLPYPEELRILRDNQIRFNGQPIAIVVANTFEQATYAASLVRASYQQQTFNTNLEAALREATSVSGGFGPPVTPRGNAQAALNEAAVKVDQQYTTPMQHHNPLGPLSTIASWQGKNLTLYDTTQWVFGSQSHVAAAFGLPPTQVRVLCPFTGGAFGVTLVSWPYVIGTAMAAQVVGRPVKLMLTRAQMYTLNGHRTPTVHRVALGATRDGHLTAILHEGLNTTSRVGQYVEGQTGLTRMLYACPNVSTSDCIAPVDTGYPTWMRAPGGVTNIYAVECAMDEPAYALNLDPLELRLRNYAETDPETGHPWSSNALRECYQQGAARFGWSRRTMAPGSMREGNVLVGWGMATAIHPAGRVPASASAQMNADGTVLIQCGATDIGGGTYTAMTQIAADALGLPTKQVRFQLGDTTMPYAPQQGGSLLTASVGSAVYEAAVALRSRLLNLIRNEKSSPLFGATDTQVIAQNGRLVLRSDPTKGVAYTDILRRARQSSVKAQTQAMASWNTSYTTSAFGVKFVEVHVDTDLRTIRVTRVVGAHGCGRIMNSKTANSQMLGGLMMGIGQALLEETVTDHRYGRIVNQDLAEYLVAVHADTPQFEHIFVNESDEHVSPIGAKGLGEITIVGVAPAIANAVFHATGKRIRDLPITLDKLL